jgi:outer membrane protein TolC
VPVSLDTVLHLAQESNGQIAIAREKLHQSEMESAAAQHAWMPNVTAGIGYYRHEGGIQNEDGTVTTSSFGALFPGVELCGEIDLQEATYRRVNAERNLWQQKGELSRVTSEKLVEAAGSYLDLLSAQRAEAISLELEKLQQEVLVKAENVAKTDKPAEIVVESTRAEVDSRRHMLAQLRQKAAGASAQLAYLLGVDPHAELVPLDKTLTAVELVDASPPTEALVEQAIANGPGVHELESMLSAIDHGLAQSQSLMRFMPVLKVDVVEGAFGAGPDSTMTWDNRLDICLAAKWNLTDALTASGRKALAESKRNQVELTLQDLRAALAAKVKEAREAIVQGRQEIAHLAEQVQHASAAYQLSYRRFNDDPKAHFSEILQSIRLLESAHMHYLAAINEYNKAQVRLLVLLGQHDSCPKPR